MRCDRWRMANSGWWIAVEGGTRADEGGPVMIRDIATDRRVGLSAARGLPEAPAPTAEAAAGEPAPAAVEEPRTGRVVADAVVVIEPWVVHGGIPVEVGARHRIRAVRHTVLRLGLARADPRETPNRQRDDRRCSQRRFHDVPPCRPVFKRPWPAFEPG